MIPLISFLGLLASMLFIGMGLHDDMPPFVLLGSFGLLVTAVNLAVTL
jgi:hypothetical protein